MSSIYGSPSDLDHRPYETGEDIYECERCRREEPLPYRIECEGCGRLYCEPCALRVVADSCSVKDCPSMTCEHCYDWHMDDHRDAAADEAADRRTDGAGGHVPHFPLGNYP